MAINDYQNPWPGLSSYQDPETTDVHLKFCGRDNDSYDVARLIDNNIFVTLYGKSGTGKTSMINAGVFPKLRKLHYFPLSIRLGVEARDISFQQCIIARIERAFQEKGTLRTRAVVPLLEDERAEEYLWRYFARTQFLDQDGQVVFPVLIFDQFEEVFRDRRADAEALLRQIHFMMDENHALSDREVDGVPYSYDFNFRFMVTIREDDLYRLEDSIDSNYLLEMKQCRYRLRNLSDKAARDVILVPGAGLFQPEEQDRIVSKLIGMARNEDDGMVSVIILSLVCSRVFDDFRKTGAPYITLSQVEKFIKGNPFERFYNEATAGLTRREKAYIEGNLVDSTGRRNSIPKSDFFKHVPNGGDLFAGSKRILRRTFSSSGGERIELIHDSFCGPLQTLKEKRERRRSFLISLGSLTLAALGVMAALFFMRLYRSNEEKTVALKKTTEQLESSLAQMQDQFNRIQADSVQMAKLNGDLFSQQEEEARLNQRLNQTNSALKAKSDSLSEALKVISNIRNLENRVNVSTESAPVTDREDSAAVAGTTVKNPVDTVMYNGMKLVRVAEGQYELDGILFSSSAPSLSELKEWAARYQDPCAEKVRGMLRDGTFRVPGQMLENDPCLVYLLLNSRSLSTQTEKQEWFDLYTLMNEEQLYKLYDIMYRESYKLADIEMRYQDKQQAIREKYAEMDF